MRSAIYGVAACYEQKGVCYIMLEQTDARLYRTYAYKQKRLIVPHPQIFEEWKDFNLLTTKPASDNPLKVDSLPSPDVLKAMNYDSERMFPLALEDFTKNFILVVVSELPWSE